MRKKEGTPLRARAVKFFFFPFSFHFLLFSPSLLTSRLIPVVPVASPPVRDAPRRAACLAALLVATH